MKTLRLLCLFLPCMLVGCGAFNLFSGVDLGKIRTPDVVTPDRPDQPDDSQERTIEQRDTEAALTLAVKKDAETQPGVGLAAVSYAGMFKAQADRARDGKYQKSVSDWGAELDKLYVEFKITKGAYPEISKTFGGLISTRLYKHVKITSLLEVPDLSISNNPDGPDNVNLDRFIRFLDDLAKGFESGAKAVQ